jgi:hypothetical protein
MAFTETQKVDIRRYCGYGVFGTFQNANFGDRFLQQYGLLEFRMNNMTPEEEAVVINNYLTNLNQLEADIPSVRNNMDMKQGAVYYWNTNEHRDREYLYMSWRQKLCQFIGINYGEGLGKGSQISISI